jgi:hypothetical protein
MFSGTRVRLGAIAAGAAAVFSLCAAAFAQAPQSQLSSPPLGAVSTPFHARTDQPARADDLRVTDWVVLVVDPVRHQANAVDSIHSTLPVAMESRRRAAAGVTRPPQPVGMIRLRGEPRENVDVLLEIRGGRFLAAWPRAEMASHRVLWRSLKAGAPPVGLADPMPVGHWLTPARQGDALWLALRNTAEPFLLYDATVDLKDLPSIQHSGDSLSLHVPAGQTMERVTLLKPDGQDWQMARMSGAATGADHSPAGVKAPAANDRGDQPAGARATTQPAASRPADSQPAGDARSSPTPAAAGVPISFDKASQDRAAVLDHWRAELQPLDLLSGDVAAIMAILSEHALDGDDWTLVYHLDRQALDRIMPLEVLPQPGRVDRVGLVVVRRIGPDVDQKLKELVAQLGDASWARREEASRQLAGYGRMARPVLDQAMKHGDIEVVHRAERLIEQMEQQ